MNLAQLIQFQNTNERFSIDLFDGWTLNFYPIRSACPDHPQLRCSFDFRCTVVIANDSTWSALQNMKTLDNLNHLLRYCWTFSVECGCWTYYAYRQFDNPKTYVTLPYKSLANYRHQGKELAINPVQTCTCPFVEDMRELTIQFRQSENHIQYRYVYTSDHPTLKSMMETLETIYWPIHLHRFPPTVSDALRLTTYLGTLFLFPLELNMLIMDYLVPTAIQQMFI